MTLRHWLAIGVVAPWMAAGCLAPPRAESSSGADRDRQRSAMEHTVAAKVSFAGERGADDRSAPPPAGPGDRGASAPADDGFVPMQPWADDAAPEGERADDAITTDGRPDDDSRAAPPRGADRDERLADAPSAPSAPWWRRAKRAGSAWVPPMLARASATPLPSATPSPSATPRPTATIPPMPTVDVIAAAGRPVRLEIPAIGVDASVEHVGLTAERAMDVPKDWMNVAWYQNGPLPGAVGNAVIAGHLDSSTGAPAVFWMLNRLAPGDEVAVTFDSGARFTFVVQELVEYDHDAEGEVIDTVFGDALTPNLNLVTCQGVWDYGNGTYDKRLVVFTALAPELTVHAAGGPVRD